MIGVTVLEEKIIFDCCQSPNHWQYYCIKSDMENRIKSFGEILDSVQKELIFDNGHSYINLDKPANVFVYTREKTRWEKAFNMKRRLFFHRIKLLFLLCLPISFTFLLLLANKFFFEDYPSSLTFLVIYLISFMLTCVIFYSLLSISALSRKKQYKKFRQKLYNHWGIRESENDIIINVLSLKFLFFNFFKYSFKPTEKKNIITIIVT
jgi:hypothetical protein